MFLPADSSAQAGEPPAKPGLAQAWLALLAVGASLALLLRCFEPGAPELIRNCAGSALLISPLWSNYLVFRWSTRPAWGRASRYHAGHLALLLTGLFHLAWLLLIGFVLVVLLTFDLGLGAP
jgi:hypothetical protein